MSKAPALPLELLFRVTKGHKPAVVGGILNIIKTWIERGKPQKPMQSRLEIWSEIKPQHYPRHKQDVEEAANEFMDGYIEVWKQKITVSREQAGYAERARNALNKMRQPNSKKQQLMMDDSNASVLDIPYTLTPQVFVKSDNIDTKSRIKAIKNRRNKPSDQPLFSD